MWVFITVYYRQSRDKMKHIKITVTGRVQGVNFRRYTLQQALELGLQGYVKNTPEGNVRIHAQGDELNLNQLLTWCKKGSPLSNVETVEVVELPLEQFTSFEIRY